MSALTPAAVSTRGSGRGPMRPVVKIACVTALATANTTVATPKRTCTRAALDTACCTCTSTRLDSKELRILQRKKRETHIA